LSAISDAALVRLLLTFLVLAVKKTASGANPGSDGRPHSRISYFGDDETSPALLSSGEY
jgi:hypothetical protein